MRFRFIWPGKTRDARFRALVEEYSDRLSHFCRCEYTELREKPGAGIEEESKRISDALRSGSVNVMLDPGGVEWKSAEVARQVQSWENSAVKEVAFVVGGPEGLSDNLLQRANKRWSLSQLTLTHEMARVLLLEQLYRAYTILHGMPYQK
ncbi:MAG: 23S rRNA (pseudouridine(1915)-N(3))-methyltransferase RlmH [Pyrinomonadaceae bacterium]